MRNSTRKIIFNNSIQMGMTDMLSRALLMKRVLSGVKCTLKSGILFNQFPQRNRARNYFDTDACRIQSLGPSVL